ncbi:Acryloyl-CoA reductase (NADH) [Glutamicibacter creatinolyticus]|uniref:Acryloyl-CoA reductase (NADH) n=1 Tax=Glutamicibacter creatinolyticus TaxID=162496 RepID=A0A5B7WPB9_9MICC|nr:acyl-CoA dehydrogenase family protein [Glutamicibacter creatinolyticus]QCY45956.1 Acryloyl-CoA reductase (NADH) [Glutamicibacter creatinolyticus]
MDLLGIETQLSPAEQARLREVRELVQQQLRTQSVEYWNKEAFPAELVRTLGAAGLGGLQLQSGSQLLRGLIHAEIARADISLSSVVGIHNELIVGMIDSLGSQEQKDTWLPRLSRFEAFGAFALTEPEHGSDVAGGLGTEVVRDGQEYVITGSKRWIGMATLADFALVWARDPESGEVGAYLVESSRPGYRASKIENKIGLRIMQNADIELDQVRIPVANKLPGATSFAAANELLMQSRAWVGWQAVGAMMATLDITRQYSLQREQFGKPIASFQLVQQSLAEIAGHLTVCLSMMRDVALRQEQGELEMVQAALAKSTATRLARESVSQGRALLGGNGVVSDGHMAKVFCDVEILHTYEGTYEINSLIVGRALTGVSAFV